MSGLYDVDTYAAAIFDLSDAFLAERHVSGFRPRPLGPIRFLVVGRESEGQMRPLPSPLNMRMGVNKGGYHLFFGKLANSEGSGYRLAAGCYRASIRSDYYQPVEMNFTMFAPVVGHGRDLPVPDDIARQAIPVDLRPALNYPFPARTTRLYGAFFYREAQGQPAAVANVRVEAFDPADNTPISRLALTDAAGSWLLVFLPAWVADAANEPAIRLRFTLPDGGPVLEVPNERIIRYRENLFPPRVFTIGE